MSEIRLTVEHGMNVTIISNSFIEKFMADANGAYVKVYLYLIYLVQMRKNFTIETACDFLGDTEKDVMRAISYWEKMGLLSVQKENKTIVSLSLIDSSIHDESVNKEIAHFVMPNNKETIEPLSVPSSLFLSAPFSEKSDEDLKLIISIAEKYLERCLSPADYGLICDLYENMNFSSDLIIHLYEYCAGNQKTDIRYIEKVALSWADEGVRTVEQAIETSNRYNKNYNSVIKAFGLARMLGESEISYVSKWLNSFQMPIELIVEACDRTLLYTNKPDFKYADSILKNWYNNSFFSLSDIKKQDEAFSSNKREQKRLTETQTKPAKAASNFPQRSYSEESFEDLEKKLLKNK